MKKKKYFVFLISFTSQHLIEFDSIQFNSDEKKIYLQ